MLPLAPSPSCFGALVHLHSTPSHRRPSDYSPIDAEKQAHRDTQQSQYVHIPARDECQCTQHQKEAEEAGVHGALHRRVEARHEEGLHDGIPGTAAALRGGLIGARHEES